MCDVVSSSGSRERVRAYNTTNASALSRLPLEMTHTRLICYLSNSKIISRDDKKILDKKLLQCIRRNFVRKKPRNIQCVCFRIKINICSI
jgi:hypothetical protein